MTGLYHVQDFTFSCKIIPSNGEPFEMKYMILEMSLFEDIFSNFMSGHIIINDSQNFINKFGLTGNEYLIINLDKPGLEEPIDRVFKIYKVGNRTQQSDTNESYVLYFVSEECLLSEQYKISKSYINTIDNIIKDISFNVLKISKNKFLEKNIEKTDGIRSITIPNYKPFETINWLCSMANSFDKNQLGSPFLFFENRDGFNFKSILSMFNNNTYSTYRYEPKNVTLLEDTRVQDFNLEYRNILSYQVVNSFDMIKNIKSGILSNKLLTIDPLRKKYSSKVFKYSDYFSETKSLNNIPNVPNAKNRNNEGYEDTSESVLRFAFTNTGQNDNKYFKDSNHSIHYNNIEFSLPYRNAQIFLLNLNKIKIKIPVDPLIKIGMVIELLFPDKATNSNNTRDKDEYLSGKYLVTAIRHIINQENSGFSIVECCKDTSNSPIGGFDNSNPAWKLIRES